MVVNPTAQKILLVAQRNVQLKGFNGFSYRDLAAEIGIKTSSIHYHFPTKDNLALALVRTFRQTFNSELTKIAMENEDVRFQLAEYVRLFEKNLAIDNRFCLCGMLASEINSLSDNVKQEIQGFFLDNERWLAQLIAKGQADGTFKKIGSPDLVAAQLLATIEGAMLIARSADKYNVSKFLQVVEGAIHFLCFMQKT